MSAAVRSSYDAKQEAIELRERALARQVLRPAAFLRRPDACSAGDEILFVCNRIEG
jgi:hypothetical protein